MKFKRIISCFLATIIFSSMLIVGTITASASVTTDIIDSQGTWKINFDIVNNIATIKSFSTDKELIDFTIPSTVKYNNDEYNIDSVPSGLLSDKKFNRIENIKISSGIKKVGTKVFSGCESLKTITIPSTLTTCSTSLGSDSGYGAFSENPNLEKIIFEDAKQKFIPNGLYAGITAKNFQFNYPRTVETVGDGAFAYSSIDEYDLPSVVTEIPSYCYAGCFNIKSLTLPENITKLNNNAFYFNKNLVSINLNKTITEIPSKCFTGCKIETITIPNNITSIGSYAFSGCSKLKTINYSNKVNRIPEYCFQNCVSLKEVNIPSTVTKVGAGAYTGCNDLTKITIPGTVTSLTDTSFPYDNANLIIYGGDNSAAETYAKKFNVKFVSISKNIKLTDSNIYMKNTSFTYVGKEIKPSFKVFTGQMIVDKNNNIVGGTYSELRLNTDYYYFYENNSSVGFASLVVVGIGDYTGTISKSFSINKKDIKDLKIIPNKTNFEYNGRPQFPKLKIYDKDTKTYLKQGIDYTTGHYSNDGIGEGKISVEGINNYKGTQYIYFNIVPQKTKAKVTNRGAYAVRLQLKNNCDFDGYKINIYDHAKKKFIASVMFNKNKSNSYLIDEFNTDKIKKLDPKKDKNKIKQIATKLRSNSTYSFDIYTYSKIMYSKYLYSPKITVTTITQATRINPTKLTKTNNSVRLNWTKKSVSGYRIKYKTNKGITTKYIAGNKTNYNCKFSLKSNVKRYFQIVPYRNYKGKKLYGKTYTLNYKYKAKNITL